MKLASPLWAGAPTTHVVLFNTIQPKVLKIIGISHKEVHDHALLPKSQPPIFKHVGSSMVLYFFSSGLIPLVLTALCPTHTL